jgi:ATP synthase protein I
MTQGEQDTPPSLEEIDARLRAVRARDPAVTDGPGGGSRLAGMGLGLRLATEVVVGVGGGAVLGWGLDRWLGTQPWLMVVFLLLGGAAGVLNAYRAARGLDDTVGLGEAQRRHDGPDADN